MPTTNDEVWENMIMVLYKHNNPKTRAIRFYFYKNKNTGTTRKAICIFCDREIASCSAKYKAPNKFDKAIEEHCFPCSKEWYSNVTEQMREEKKEDSKC